jgi:hypothetical protein
MKKYTKNDVEKALETLSRTTDRLTLLADARRYGIRLNTLTRRNKNNNLGFHGSGTKIALSQQTELLIVRIIICFADWGHGLTFYSIQSIIQEYLKDGEQN